MSTEFIVVNEKLAWNGTDLGVGKALSSQKVLKDEISIVMTEFGAIYCMIERYTSIAVIFDRIKKMLNMHNRGCHTITIGKTKKIVYNVPMKDGYILHETPLSMYASDINTTLLTQIREHALLCYIMNLSLTTGSLYVLYDKILISRCKGELKTEKSEEATNSGVYKRWLKGVMYSDVISGFLGIDLKSIGDEEYLVFITSMKDNVERIVREVDTDQLLLCNFVMSKMKELVNEVRG